MYYNAFSLPCPNITSAICAAKLISRQFAISLIRRLGALPKLRKYPAKRLNSAVFLKFCALSAKKTNIADAAATRLRKF